MSDHGTMTAPPGERNARKRNRLAPAWVLAAGLLLAAAGVSRCDCAGNPGGSCQCETHEECPEAMHCGGCWCQPDCSTNADCPPDMPNCGPDGICFAACETNADCPEVVPNCNTTDGICFPPCETAVDCVDPASPNCEPSTGLCFPPCESDADCPPEFPNCDPNGICMAPCETHADCTHPALPNCQMDPALDLHGMCTEPCVDASDCDSALYPNCDPSPGTCFEPCLDDDGCVEEFPECDVPSGICEMPDCFVDTDCNPGPPDQVCEGGVCVPGCETHADCDPADRCDLIDPGNLNHCEPRDCLDDGDCNPPITVCDTDGLADPLGGGYCLDGCETYYDCPIGYDCHPVDATCLAHDYGDQGEPCAMGCDSDFCLVGSRAGDVCTDFCCVQHDCLPGWGCRPYDDGTGGDIYMVDVCQPLDATQGDGRYGEPCTQDDHCRSNDCYGNVCLESCCTGDDCGHLPGTACMPASGRTMCRDPGTGLDPLGTPGCGTTGSAGDCLSNLCYSFLSYDTGCVTDQDCINANPNYPTCALYQSTDPANDPTITDCVADRCVDHCCSTADCPTSAIGESFYCAKVRFGFADINACLRYPSPGSLGEGEGPCTTGSQCRSHYCGANGLCRERCCSDADCTDATYPRCKLEQHWSANQTRWVNVCMQ